MGRGKLATEGGRGGGTFSLGSCLSAVECQVTALIFVLRSFSLAGALVNSLDSYQIVKLAPVVWWRPIKG